jgi:PAS domain-containing protein
MVVRATPFLTAGVEALQARWAQLQAQVEALAIERQRYAELFALAGDAYLMTDMRCTIREVNGAAAQLFQRPAQSLAGKPLVCLIALEHRRAFRRQLAGLDRGKRWVAAVQQRKSPPLPVSFSVCAVQAGTGPIRGYCWLLRPSP